MGGINMKYGVTATIAILAAVFLGVFGLIAPTPASAQIWQIQSCADCHNNGSGGEQPSDAVAGVRNNPAGAVAGSHGAHFTAGASVTPVACTDCHIEPLRTPPAYDHGDGNIDLNLGITYSRGGTVPQDANVVLADLGTCATAACHDDGLGAQLPSPQWGTDLANCTQCHAAAPSTGSHTAHLNDSAVCADCHDSAVQGTTYPSQHLDGNVDVFDAAAGDLGYPQDVAKGTLSWSGCNAATCHEDGRNNLVMSPTWGSTPPQCSECHQVQPPTGSHGGHLGSNIIAGVVCADCHVDAIEGTSASATDHRDGNIDTVLALGYTQNKTKASAFESCASASCHNDGLNGVVASPVWGATVNECAECHADAPTTGSHTVHLAETDCTSCHNTADPATDTEPGQHRDGNVDVYATTAGDLGYTQNAAIGSGSWSTCNQASCHQDGKNNLVTSPTWGSTPPQCTECHESRPNTGSHIAHLTNTITPVNCANCHDNAVEGVSADPTIHRDGNLDTVAARGYPQNKTLGSAPDQCQTAFCHDNGTGTIVPTPIWGTSTTCSACHANPPATGSHGAHLTSTQYASTVACGDCHQGAIQGSDPGVAHYDTNIDTVGALGYTQNKAKATPYESCATASCHDNGTGAVVATPVWGTPSVCNECHATQPNTGAHQAHLTTSIPVPGGVNCGDCHDGAVEGSNQGTAHWDGNVDTIAGLGYPQNKTKGSAAANCTTASCHDDGTGTLRPTLNWNQTSACGDCHDASPTTGSHSAHFTSTYVSGANVPVCADCHDGAVEGTTAPAQHYDGDVDVYDTAAGDLGYPIDKTKGSAYASCNAAYCHSDGLGNNTTVTWGSTPATCATNYCHGYPPTATNPAHTTSTTCSDCHTQVSSVDNASFSDPSTHMDGTVDIPTGLGCDSCHGYPGSATHDGPDVADGQPAINIEGKGAHLAHIAEIQSRTGATLNASSDTYDPAGVGVSAGVTAVCGTCHDLASGNHGAGGGTGTVNMIGTVENYRFAPGAANDPVYNGTPGVGSATTPKNCSNISCHFTDTPVWQQP